MNLSNEFVEGLKQLVRITLIAVVPVLISQLQSGNGIDWNVVLVVAAIAILSGLDKWAHKSGTKNAILDLEGMDALKK